MSRYIDTKLIPALFDEEFKKTRKLIIEGETHLDNLAEGFSEADRVIQRMPTADVVEVRHGEWLVTEKGCVIFCSECNTRLELCYPDGTEIRNLPYCPICGAKMGRERSKE